MSILKVFSMEELQLIADLCKKYNVICISDEVYEWLVYGGVYHIRIGELLFKIHLKMWLVFVISS